MLYLQVHVFFIVVMQFVLLWELLILLLICRTCHFVLILMFLLLHHNTSMSLSPSTGGECVTALTSQVYGLIRSERQQRILCLWCCAFGVCVICLIIKPDKCQVVECFY